MPPDLNLRAPENRLAYFLLLAPVCGDAALVRMEAEEKMIPPQHQSAGRDHRAVLRDCRPQPLGSRRNLLVLRGTLEPCTRYRVIAVVYVALGIRQRRRAARSASSSNTRPCLTSTRYTGLHSACRATRTTLATFCKRRCSGPIATSTSIRRGLTVAPGC